MMTRAIQGTMDNMICKLSGSLVNGISSKYGDHSNLTDEQRHILREGFPFRRQIRSMHWQSRMKELSLQLCWTSEEYVEPLFALLHQSNLPNLGVVKLDIYLTRTSETELRDKRIADSVNGEAWTAVWGIKWPRWAKSREIAAANAAAGADAVQVVDKFKDEERYECYMNDEYMEIYRNAAEAARGPATLEADRMMMEDRLDETDDHYDPDSQDDDKWTDLTPVIDLGDRKLDYLDLTYRKQNFSSGYSLLTPVVRASATTHLRICSDEWLTPDLKMPGMHQMTVVTGNSPRFLATLASQVTGGCKHCCSTGTTSSESADLGELSIIVFQQANSSFDVYDEHTTVRESLTNLRAGCPNLQQVFYKSDEDHAIMTDLVLAPIDKMHVSRMET